jgi:hypothetical protein
MTLWHRAPREVYRVYGEDEYLADDALSAEEEPFAPRVAEEESFTPQVAEESCAPPTGEEFHRTPTHNHATYHYSAVAPPLHRSRSGRLLGLGLLAGVTVGALGLVALNAAHRSPAAPPADAAQTAHADAAAHTSTGAPVADGSVVHMPNSHDHELRAPAHARTPRTRAVTHFSTEHPSTGHPSTGHPSTGHASTGHPSTWRVGEAALPGGPAESVSKGTSAAASTESAQPWQSTTSEPMGSGAQAPPIGGEFEFER